MPTYGVGKALDGNQWRSVFRQLVGRGYLSVDLDRFGALKLEEQCRALLKGEETIALRQDQVQKTARRQTKSALPDDINVGLWEALRECRRLLADEQGVPPYVIFHDSTLVAMCSSLPNSMEEFAALSGVGERKLAKYGAQFLQAIREASPAS